MNPPGKASPRVLALFDTLLVTILQLVGMVVLIVELYWCNNAPGGWR